MDQRSLPRILIISTLLGLLSAGLAQAATPTGEEILEGLNASPKEITRLDQGGVVNFSGESWEQTKRELAADSVVVINKPLKDVLEKTLDDASLVPANKVLDSGDIQTLEDFSVIAFTADDRDIKEAERILSAQTGKDLNLSKDEIAKIQSRAAKLKRDTPDTERLAVASDAMRDILISRYQAYQEKGLAGIEPYARSSKKSVSVGDELRLTTEMHTPIEEFFPEYYATLVNYPENADCCEHRFYWLKVKMVKRPAWALVHRITLQGDDFALVTERYFYTTHSLNSLQITVAWLPYGDGSTYLGLATSASADILSGFIPAQCTQYFTFKAGENIRARGCG